MTHFYHLSEVQLDRPSIVTIGVFDGVHRGHQHLISQLVRQARAINHASVVLTLFPHPDRVIHGKTGRYYLTSPEQKARLLTDLGVDAVITHPFDEQVRQIRAADFVDQLCAHLGMSSLWVTADFAMGYQREGNFTLLKALGKDKGFEVHQIELLMNDSDAAISSTAIREALMAGNVERAAEWLGRPYSVEGTVVHGSHRGHSLGFPTANMDVWDEQVLPANGIYACWVVLNDQRYMAATSVGISPQFNEVSVRVEPYILDFDQDIYRQKLQLEFVARLRDEAKFDNLDALIAQINEDVRQCRELLSKIAKG